MEPHKNTNHRVRKTWSGGPTDPLTVAATGVPLFRWFRSAGSPNLRRLSMVRKKGFGLRGVLLLELLRGIVPWKLRLPGTWKKEKGSRERRLTQFGKRGKKKNESSTKPSYGSKYQSKCSRSQSVSQILGRPCVDSTRDRSNLVPQKPGPTRDRSTRSSGLGDKSVPHL